MGERGVTLVELLVGLMVAGILLTMAIPGYAFLTNATRLATTTNDLMTALHLARSEAIKRGVLVTVCKTGGNAAGCSATAGWELGWLVFVDGGTPGVVDGADASLWAANGSSGVRITSKNYSRYLSYRPNGGSRGTNGLANGSISICVAGSGRDIIINGVGRPRLASSSNC